jgi:uncharacterized protein (TIGR00730 family)
VRIAVFTGSSPGHNAAVARAVASFGAALGARGVGVVYGGGSSGLMGVLASAALGAGGEVVGVMPRNLGERENAHPGLTRLEMVDTMHERKARMAQLADGFVALPGGPGTLEEFFEAWTWQQIGIHSKPVALLDIGGFWAPLLATLDASVDAGFTKARHRDSLIVSDGADDLLARFAAWPPPIRPAAEPRVAP